MAKPAATQHKHLASMGRSAVLALLLAVGLVPMPVLGAIDSGAWYRYTSDHFEVYSKQPERLVAKRIQALEAYRGVVHLLTGHTDKKAAEHTTKLMLLSGSGEISNLYKVKQASGFMRPGLRSNLLVVAKKRKDSSLEQANEVAFHEYSLQCFAWPADGIEQAAARAEYV